MTTRARAGFTLWEMTIVFAVMAVTALLVVPQWLRRADDTPATATSSLLALLHDARQLAINAHQVVAVHLDPLSGAYRVDTTSVVGSGAVAEGQLTLGALESIETDKERLAFVFQPTGAAFADTLLVRSPDGAQLIAVDPWSGVAGAYAR
jgi:Tfp pilus assembly protein FimT